MSSIDLIWFFVDDGMAHCNSIFRRVTMDEFKFDRRVFIVTCFMLSASTDAILILCQVVLFIEQPDYVRLCCP